MARRNPQNERYRKDAKVGATRRSAASAKPKRELGDTSSSSKPVAKKGASKSGPRYLPNPDTPEFRRWNIINYSMLGVALGAAVVLTIVQTQIHGAAGPLGVPKEWIVYALWGVWALGLGGSMYIQFSILRKMRAEWEASGRAEARARDIDRERAEKAAAKKAEADEKAKAKADAPKPVSSKDVPKPDDVAKLPPMNGKDDR